MNLKNLTRVELKKLYDKKHQELLSMSLLACRMEEIVKELDFIKQEMDKRGDEDGETDRSSDND